jgi:3-hydroxyisobutyrate dehydrogenase-like beta-hydroxyacid dehydrogenase
MDVDNARPAVGLLHPGSMGASLGGALVDRGLRVYWASAGRSDDSAKRAELAGLDDAGTVDALVRRVDVLFSICPPDAALEVAKSVAGAGYSGLYVDANATSPATALSIQEVLESPGAAFVDGDLIGGPLHPGGATRLYLSGPAAATAADLFAGTDRVEAVVLDGDVTAASALKMCYAAWTKGTSALLLAVLAAARATGVEGPLVSEWRRSQPDLLDRMEGARRAGPKAWRFAGEMDEMARCFADASVPSGFPRAAADIYRRLEDVKGTEPDLDSVVRSLLASN